MHWVFSKVTPRIVINFSKTFPFAFSVYSEQGWYEQELIRSKNKPFSVVIKTSNTLKWLSKNILCLVWIFGAATHLKMVRAYLHVEFIFCFPREMNERSKQCRLNEETGQKNTRKNINLEKKTTTFEFFEWIRIFLWRHRMCLKQHVVRNLGVSSK